MRNTKIPGSSINEVSQMNLDKKEVCPHYNSDDVIDMPDNYCTRCSSCGLVFAVI